MTLRNAPFAWRLSGLTASAWAAAFLLSACETERPGVFYDVRFQSPPPNTVCVEFAREVAARTGLQTSGKSFQMPRQPDSCDTWVADTLDPQQRPHLGVGILTDPTRNLLLVDVWEREHRKPWPSAQAKQLGETLVELAHERFPDAQITPGKRVQGPFAP